MNNTITLSDESGIEILVNYSKELETTEHGAGFLDTQDYAFTLNSVELVIAGEGINLTKQLSLKQYRAILDEVIERDLIEA